MILRFRRPAPLARAWHNFPPARVNPRVLCEARWLLRPDLPPDDENDEGDEGSEADNVEDDETDDGGGNPWAEGLRRRRLQSGFIPFANLDPELDDAGNVDAQIDQREDVDEFVSGVADADGGGDDDHDDEHRESGRRV